MEADDEDEHPTDHHDAQSAELAFKENHRAHYGKREKKESKLCTFYKGKGWSAIEVGSPMDDFINAHVNIRCRRIVPEVYFGNDQTCELSLLPLVC